MPCACCCSQCSYPEHECCGGEYPRLVGVCCEGVWRIGGGVCCDGTWRTGPGVCCGGVWQTGSGVCCAGVWRTGPGGCCGGVWHSGAGYCCGGTWHSNANPDAPCPDGYTFHRWGEGLACCGCVPPELFDPELNGGLETTEDVLAALCCPVCSTGFVLRNEYGECPGQCCDGQNCVDSLESECTGTSWTYSACCSVGCPTACCTETATGFVECGIAFSSQCVSPSVAAESCESGCLGECCVDGVSQGQTTQSGCDSLGGLWGGLGSTTCQGAGDCRSPFSENCCETKQSSGAGLIFIQPYRKRTPPFQGTLRATATGTTDSPIRVHGVTVGQAGKRCPFTVTFPLCRDRFEIEPIPCGSTFHRVDVTVCWEEVETTTETINFSACNGLNWSLSDCDKDCVTTLVYTGSGATTNARLTLYWDATIQADGSGPLVLTNAITQSGTCDRTLTLSGSSDHANEIRTINDAPGSAVCHVIKEGTGRWRFNATSRAFHGDLTVRRGTLQVGNAGSLGSAVILGDTAASGVAALLLEKDVIASFDVIVPPGSQTVFIGGANTTGSAILSSGVIFMARDVTLVAKTGGSVNFSNTWSGVTYPSTSAYNVNIGAPGYAGEVQLFNAGTLETTGDVAMEYGTVALGYSTLLVSPTLTLGSEGGPVSLDLNGGTSRHGNLVFVGGGNTVTNSESPRGSLRLDNGGSTATVTAGGTGNEIESTVTLDDQTAFAISGGLEISGDINGDSGITKSGAGTLTLSGALSYSGTTDITAGSVVTQTLVSGPAKFTSATFTPSGLTVAFSSTPASAEQYRLLPGATTQTYGTVTLTGAGSATATYDSSTSTLTID